MARPATARYERVGSGWAARWGEVEVRSRSLAGARVEMVEAIARRRGTYPGNVFLDDDIDLPDRVRVAVEGALAARAAAARAHAESNKATERAVARLAESGVSLRDAGYLLGISHARVKQISDSSGRSEE